MAKPAQKKPAKKMYNFTVVLESSRGKLVSDFGEIFTGDGATPEEALASCMDEHDLESGQTQRIFYFTFEENSETGFLTVTRTGLKIERA